MIDTGAVSPGIGIVDRTGVETVFGSLDDFVEDRLLDFLDLFFELILHDVVYLAQPFPYLRVEVVFDIIIGPTDHKESYLLFSCCPMAAHLLPSLSWRRNIICSAW